MSDINLRERATPWVLYCGLCSIFCFLYLLPLNVGSSFWIAPDLILGLSYLWTLRRPNEIPVLLIAAVLFMSDLLFQRPPGLMTAIGVVGCEFLRSRAPFLREVPYFVEWFVVTVVVMISFLANRIVLSLVMVPTAAFSTEVIHAVATVISFPLTTLFFSWAQKLNWSERDLDKRRRL